MALSFVQYEGNGSQQTFAIPFPYLDKSHIEVRVALDVHPFTWDDPQTIRISPAPAAGAVIEARRITPRDNRMVDFVDGSVLTEGDLDLSVIQTFYIVQEAIDIAGGTLELLPDGSYGAGGRRIKELGTAIEPRDAITKEYHDGTWIPQMQAILDATSAERSAAQAARSGAEAARDLAAQYRDTALAHRNAAATSATNAANSASASQTSRLASEAARDLALSYRDTANSHRVAAETARTGAETARSGAESARNTASTKASEAASSASAAASSASAAAQSAAQAALWDPNNYWTISQVSASIADSTQGKLDKTGGVVTGVINASFTNAHLRLTNTARGESRALLNQDGLLGFTGNDGNWTFRVGDDGSVWTRQFGDLNARIEQRAADYANDRANQRVYKGGDSMWGDLEIAKADAQLRLHYPGIFQWSILAASDANLWFRDAGNGELYFMLNRDGNIYCRNRGWVWDAINGRADRGAQVQHNSGIAEFGNIDVAAYDVAVDLPNPWVLTGLRSASGSDRRIWLRGVWLRNN